VPKIIDPHVGQTRRAPGWSTTMCHGASSAAAAGQSMRGEALRHHAHPYSILRAHLDTGCYATAALRKFLEGRSGAPLV
jgi:hypothetical protein